MRDAAAGVVPAINRAFDHIAQFAYIARPRIRDELRQRVRGKARPIVPAQFGGHAPAEVVRQHRHIAFARTQRRQRDHLKAQPVEQIGAEPPFRRHRGQVVVGGRHDPHIDMHRLGCTDARDFAVFDRAQQPFLRAHRQRGEFVEEQRALVRLFEAPDPCARRTGECAGFMAEQFGLDQRFGQCCAIERDQRFTPARAQAVEAFGDQFLAGAAFADHQHRTAHRCSAAGAFDRIQKHTRLSDELYVPVHDPNLSVISQD